jgi:hypothetical protein
MACDMCGKVGVSLNSLLESYQTDDIKDICPTCEKEVNKQLSKLRSWTMKFTRNKLKEYMTNIKNKVI